MTTKTMFYIMVAILVATILGSAFMYYKSNSVLAESLKEIDTIEKKIQQQDAEILNIDYGFARYQRLEDELPSLESILPSGKDQSAVVAQLSSIANNNGISLGNVSFSASSSVSSAKPRSNTSTSSSTSSGPDADSLTTPGVVEGTSVLTMSISENGIQYSNFINFVKAIEQSQRPFNIVDLSVTPDAKNANGSVSFSMVIEAFVFTKTENKTTSAATGIDTGQLNKSGMGIQP